MPQRRLAAILAADIVGYSRLIERDEVGTVDRMRADRNELIDPSVTKHGGHIVRLAGDGALLEFSSIVEATLCAIAIQQGMRERNAQRPMEDRVVFRMGVNIGDIIVEDDNLHGDGINVAARLESLCDPGSVLISEEAARQVEGKIDVTFEYIGERSVKNIERPVRVWQVKENGLTTGTHQVRRRRRLVPRTWAVAALGLTLTAGAGLLGWWLISAPHDSVGELGNELKADTKATIAVLPFTNLSDDPEQEYFVDGVSEDIITDLSRIADLAVIARNSSFVYRDRSVDIRQVGRELGADYVLEGSVRKVANRIRVNAQLIDTSTGTHLWAERFDEEMFDVFAVQDRVIRRIVKALSVTLTPAADRMLASPYTTNAQAYDLFLRGQNLFLHFITERFDEARDLFRKAIELDPRFARAYSALAVTYVNEVLQGVAKNPKGNLQQSMDLARTATALDPNLPQAYFVLGYAHLFQFEFDRAIVAVDKALELAPSYADALMLLAFVYAHMDRAQESFPLIEQAMRLNPAYPAEYVAILGQANYYAGNFDKAVAYLEEALQRNPAIVSTRVRYIAALSAIGQDDEAEWQAQELLVLNPDFSVEEWVAERPLTNPDRAAQLAKHLRQAGLP